MYNHAYIYTHRQTNFLHQCFAFLICDFYMTDGSQIWYSSEHTVASEVGTRLF